MDEYFCTRCGAILNDQCGFDPYGGTWTCNECGQLLMDDDVYDGDTYPGVAWYCDECDSLMNIQPGFSDIYGSWTCTECGHVNGITENDIYESQKDYEYQEKKVEKSDFISSFIDNLFSGSDVNNSDDEDESDDYYDKTDYCKPDRKDESLSSRYYRLSSMMVDKKYNIKLLITRLKAFFFNKKNIYIGYDSDVLLGKDVEFVLTSIHNRAFNNIKVLPVKDIYIDSIKSEGEIEQIIVAGSAFFESKDSFPYDVEIIITYHEKREITVPFAANSLRKQNYLAVKDRLLHLGFTEIYEQPIRDLKIGWLIKDGAVEKVSISGNETFKKNTIYKYDAEIIINYHTF